MRQCRNWTFFSSQKKNYASETLIMASMQKFVSFSLSILSMFSMLLLLSLLLLSVVLTGVAGRKVHRCFVARKLKEHTIYQRSWDLKQFLCVVDMVSGFNVSYNVNRLNGQRTVGIFQFPSKWYCVDEAREDTRAGRCHQLCSAFLDEDLKNDVTCASIAVNQYGFRFWKGWEEKCLLKKLDHYLEGCAL